jgi:uncharacterized membrane protein
MESSQHVVELIHQAVEWAALGIELIAVVVIVAAVVFIAVTRGTVRYLFKLKQRGAFESYKHVLAKPLLLGLEFLVAADIVRTVASQPTLSNVSVLGLLVLVRTFLSWSMEVEVEGRWPWQGRSAATGNEALAQPPVVTAK